MHRALRAAWAHGTGEMMADEGTLFCQMKFVTNSHLLRSYKVCAEHVIICYTFF